MANLWVARAKTKVADVTANWKMSKSQGEEGALGTSKKLRFPMGARSPVDWMDTCTILGSWLWDWVEGHGQESWAGIGAGIFFSASLLRRKGTSRRAACAECMM